MFCNVKAMAVVLMISISLFACGKSESELRSEEKRKIEQLKVEATKQSSLAVEEAVKAQLKDPASARFKVVAFSESGQQACTVWNAKNSMGGYGDWQVAWLLKKDSNWRIEQLDMRIGQQFECSDAAFKLWVAEEDALKATLEMAKTIAIKQAYATIQRVKQVPYEEAVAIGKEQCGKLIDAMGMDAVNIANPARKPYRSIAENRINVYFADLEKMNCGKYSEKYLDSVHYADCVLETKIKTSYMSESTCSMIFNKR